MSLLQYPEYQESGSEWLGRIPEHWAVTPLKWALKNIESGTSVNAVDLPREMDAFGILKTSCVYKGWFDWTENKTVLEEDLDRVSCPLKTSTLIVSRMNTPDLVGATGLVDYAPAGIFLPDRLWQVSFADKHSPRFFHYFTKSQEYRGQIKLVCSGTSSSMQNLGQDDFRGIVSALPPESEQIQIARFLDHETAKIDALIREQEHLIELLQEQRQAVISHAVTKGLDPDVPLKDSGVEWLGEVPAHWEAKPLRYLGECQNGINIGGDAFGSGFPFIGYGHVYKNDVLPLVTSELVESSKLDRERYSVKRGDVFFTRTSETVDEIGFSATCFHDIDSAVFAGFLIRFRPLVPDLTVEFSRYYFSNQRLREFFNKEMNLVTRASLSQDLLKKMVVTLPPVQEQSSISSHLDQVTGKVDSLISEARASSELLVERRSALISAAVTGKIDVRDWQPPADESAFDEEVRKAGLEATA